MKNPSVVTEGFCREDRIRTCDPLVPNQVFYRAELPPEPVELLQGTPVTPAVREGFEPSVQL